MTKWFTTTMLAAALACPGALAHAEQPAPAPGQLPPAPPPDAPQPANDGDEADPAAAPAAPPAAAEADARRQMEIELHNLAQGQRALAVARAQQADGVGGIAQMRLMRGKTEKAAWLGVSTSKVSPALQHQLKLKNKYIGLIVERVEPKSPADEAGLEQFDIIEKVGDQWIVNTEQFSVVLRMNEPGKEVELSIIRQGQPQTLKVKLAEKELPVLGANNEWINMPQAVVAGGGNVFEIAPEGRFVFRHGELNPLLEMEDFNKAESSSFTMRDEEHTLKVNTKKGKRHLVASDANGVVIYDGPINTAEEIGNVPEEIREKVQKLDDMPGARAAKATKKTPDTAPANEKE